MFSIKRKILIMLSLTVITTLPINALSKDKDCTNASKKCAKIKGVVKGFAPSSGSATVNSAKSKKKVKVKGRRG